MFFDTLHLADEVLLFTICATVTKLVDFSKKEGHNRLLSATLVRSSMYVMFAKHIGPVVLSMIKLWF